VASVKYNFFLNSVYQLITMAVPLVTTPYLSRVFHAEGIGEYTFAYTIAYYFVTLAMLGMNNYGNRAIAANRNNYGIRHHQFWSIFYLQLIVSIIIFLVYVFYAFFISKELISKIFSIYVFSSILDINWFFWGMERFKVTVTRNVFIKLATTIFIFILVKDENDIWKYALITSLGFFISQIILWWYLFKELKPQKVNFTEIFSHLRPTLVLFIPVIAVSIYKIIDRIMLGFMSNDTELGYFESSEKIIQIPIAFVVSLGIVMLPRMTMVMTKKDEIMEKNYLNNSSNFAILLSSFLCFLIISVSDIFVPLFYGNGFEKCVDLYMILLPGCIFLALSNVVRTQYLIPKHLDSIYVKAVVIGAFVNVLLNILLIPKYASIGVAISTLLTEIAVCLYQLLKIHYQPIFIQSIKKNIKFILGFMIIGILVFFLPISNTPFALLIIKCLLFISLSFILLSTSVITYCCKTGRRVGLKSYKTYFENY